MSRIAIDYQTLPQYQRALYQDKRINVLKKIIPQSSYTPINPVRPQMRMFSESPIPEGKGKFFDFLKEAEKADQEAAGAGAETPVEQAQQEELEIEFETS